MRYIFLIASQPYLFLILALLSNVILAGLILHMGHCDITGLVVWPPCQTLGAHPRCLFRGIWIEIG